jgi:hypothetical protein
VNDLVRRWRTSLRVLALALIVAAVPLPVLADEGKQSAARPGLQASIKPVVRAMAATAALASKESAQAAPVDKSALESKSFFKKPVGLLILGVMAAGTGYAIYSASHDRIPPTGR